MYIKAILLILNSRIGGQNLSPPPTPHPSPRRKKNKELISTKEDVDVILTTEPTWVLKIRKKLVDHKYKILKRTPKSHGKSVEARSITSNG